MPACSAAALQLDDRSRDLVIKALLLLREHSVARFEAASALYKARAHDVGEMIPLPSDFDIARVEGLLKELGAGAPFGPESPAFRRLLGSDAALPMPMHQEEHRADRSMENRHVDRG